MQKRGATPLPLYRILEPSTAGRSTAAEEPAAPPPTAAEVLKRIDAETFLCTRCIHHRHRRRPVNGAGDAAAKMMFVGEAPGAEEDQKGVNFSGRSGRLLDRIIAAMGLARESVWTTNLLRCRVPGDMKIKREEVEACRHFLERETAAVAPLVIVPLGLLAWRWFAPADDRPMAEVRGRLYRRNGALLAPTYHPAYLLRRADAKGAVWEDMKRAAAALKSAENGGVPEASPLPEPPPADRGLFDDM